MKILKYFKASFFQWLSTGFFVLLLTSCGSYTYESYRPKIKSLLAITEEGDTVSVSMREFERQKYDTYTRFNWNNQWYWNNWRYDFNWGWQPWWFAQPNRYWWGNNLRYTNPSRGYRTPSRPQTQPQRRPQRSRVATPRGSRSNYTPQRQQRTTTPNRTRTTPNVQTRTNVGRGSTGGRRNNQ